VISKRSDNNDDVEMTPEEFGPEIHELALRQNEAIGEIFWEKAPIELE
jgi:hypothetical protein